MNAQKLEEAILREVQGGPTELIDIPHLSMVAITAEEAVERFRKENPDAIVYDDFEHGEDGCARVPIKPCPPWASLYLAVYELQQNYGGGEEGGWWYDSGEVVETQTVRVSFREDRTPYLEEGERAFLGKLAEKWATDYDGFGTTHRTSTRPRGRDFSWQVEWDTPEDFPKRRPHYE